MGSRTWNGFHPGEVTLSLKACRQIDARVVRRCRVDACVDRLLHRGELAANLKSDTTPPANHFFTWVQEYPT